MFTAWIINSLSNGHFENSDCDQIVVPDVSCNGPPNQIVLNMTEYGFIF